VATYQVWGGDRKKGLKINDGNRGGSIGTRRRGKRRKKKHKARKRLEKVPTRKGETRIEQKKKKKKKDHMSSACDRLERKEKGFPNNQNG